MGAASLRRTIWIGLALVGGSSAWAASAYEDIVAPIFRARCASCHGEEKQKGRLALHTWDRAAKGGDSGPLWVAGKPDDSELMRRLRLPLDEEEHMPPADEPQLTKDEVALLVRWIERGASATAPVSELNLSADLAKAAAELRTALASASARPKHVEPVWELDGAAVTKARAPLARTVAELQQRFPGALSYESRSSAALNFTAAGLGRSFTDEDLARLVPLADALVLLDLSRTAVTDRAAPTLGRFANVRVLRLGFTDIGDGALEGMTGLNKLEQLVLTETRTSTTGLAALEKLSGLRRLHLDGALAESARQKKLPLVDAGMEAFATPTDAEKTAESRN